MAAAQGGGSPTDEPALIVSVPGALILAANSAFCQRTGFTDEQLQGQPLRHLQPPSASSSLIGALQQQQAGSGFAAHESFQLRMEDGRIECATIRSSPLYCIESGALQGFSLMLTFPPPGAAAARKGPTCPPGADFNLSAAGFRCIT